MAYKFLITKKVFINSMYIPYAGFLLVLLVRALPLPGNFADEGLLLLLLLDDFASGFLAGAGLMRWDEVEKKQSKG